MAQRKNLNIYPLLFLVDSSSYQHHNSSYLGFYVLALIGGKYVMIMTYTLLSHVGH
jgi:hypothetical protein